MVQQLGIGDKTEWESQAMSRSSKTKPLIRPVHRGPTLNDIFPKLKSVQYHSLIDASLGDHNMKLDDRLSYLTTFACHFGRYR